MTLNSQYTYLFLDFETTGLDLSSDFPIQIGLIEIDQSLTVKKHYSSYICLPDGITKLRNNVSYMTGINIETIEKEGKALETVQEEIKDFFGPKTVLVGQNIGFDIGFLRKFFPGLEFAHQVDTYPLAASSIPYLKSYSLESIDQELSNKYPEYKQKKQEIISLISNEKSISAHDALYDCGMGVCVMYRRTNQLKAFGEQFSLVKHLAKKIKGEGIVDFIEKNEGIEDINTIETLPILSSPLANEKKNQYAQTIDRSKEEQHSKRSTRGIDLEQVISELPHPCIIAVSHGSKIDIIKRNCKEESFDYLKEEQVFDQEKVKLWCSKEVFTNEEFLFIIFYLSHYRDGYRILQGNLPVHKHIIHYLQVKKVELKKDKKILCTHGGLYYTIQNNPERKETYKEYPICILDADRRHTTYNDYAQKGIFLSSLLYQREKFEYTLQQEKDLHTIEIVNNIITTISFFIAHFEHESEKYFFRKRQNKRETNYIFNDINYSDTVASRKSLEELRDSFKNEHKEIPKYISDSMERVYGLFHSPIKIQRNSNQNKHISYTLGAAVRYIDFAEYLRMFGNHRVFFFSPARSEYKKFLEHSSKKDISIIREDTVEKTKTIVEESKLINIYNISQCREIKKDI